jgi:hypothetical protein
MSMEPVGPAEFDPALARAWREASGEQPRETLDDAIRAAARRAVHAGPRRPAASLVQRWRLPLSIAALVVVSASISLMISQRDAHLPSADAERVTVGKTKQAAAPTEPAAAEESTRDEARLGAQEAPPPATPMPLQSRAAASGKAEVRADGAKLERTAPMGSQPAIRGERSPPSVAAPDLPTAEQPSAGVARPVAPSDVQASQAGAAPAPLQPAPETAKLVAPSTRAVEPEPGSSRVPARDASAEAERRAPSTELKHEASPPAASARAKAQMSPAAPEQHAADGNQADALPPLEWIERIRELRRGGHRAEAEASLKAFRERYPDYVLPADLIAPR